MFILLIFRLGMLRGVTNKFFELFDFRITDIATFTREGESSNVCFYELNCSHIPYTWTVESIDLFTACNIFFILNSYLLLTNSTNCQPIEDYKQMGVVLS